MNISIALSLCLLATRKLSMEVIRLTKYFALRPIRHNDDLYEAVDTLRSSPQRTCFMTWGDIAFWDVSKVTCMKNLFSYMGKFNSPIGSWDTSQVTNMRYMFHYCSEFNQPIGNWDVSRVVTMESMFQDAWKFNQDINAWNVEKVTSMRYMFYKAYQFSGTLDKWNVMVSRPNVCMMFAKANSFRGQLGPTVEEAYQLPNHTNMFALRNCFMPVAYREENESRVPKVLQLLQQSFEAYTEAAKKKMELEHLNHSSSGETKIERKEREEKCKEWNRKCRENKRTFDQTVNVLAKKSKMLLL